MNYYVQVGLLAEKQERQCGHDSFLCYTINNVFREEVTFYACAPRAYFKFHILRSDARRVSFVRTMLGSTAQSKVEGGNS
jgi:hypothetical protein